MEFASHATNARGYQKTEDHVNQLHVDTDKFRKVMECVRSVPTTLYQKGKPQANVQDHVSK